MNNISLHQSSYIESLELAQISPAFSDLSSWRSPLSWIDHIRPKICCEVAFAVQAFEESFKREHLSNLNKIIKNLLARKELKFNYSPLDEENLIINAYSEYSFANKEGPLLWNRIIRVTSWLCFQCRNKFLKPEKRKKFKVGTGRRILCVFKSISLCLHLKTRTKRSQTGNNKLLNIDRGSVRKSYEDVKWGKIGLIRSQNNPGDAFIKAKLVQLQSKYSMKWIQNSKSDNGCID